MNRERSLKIVRGHVPLHVPPGAAQAGLEAAVAVVLSTSRSNVPDIVLDHALWLACMKVVGAVVSATTSEVYARPKRRFLERLRRRRQGLPAGSLNTYGERLLGDPSLDKVDTDVWEIVLWRNGADLVAAASCEAWYAVGGPPLYHDSYTTSIFVKPAQSDRLVEAIQLNVSQAGGWVEAIVVLPA